MAVEAVKACLTEGFPDRAHGINRATVRLVAVAIADIVNGQHGWQFYGALGTVADDLGLGLRTVRRAVAHLVDAGVIEVIEERPGRTTLYRWKYGLPRPTQAAPPAYPGRGTPAYPGRRTKERTQLTSIKVSDMLKEGHPLDCEGGCEGTGWVEVGDRVVDRCGGRPRSARLPA